MGPGHLGDSRVKGHAQLAFPFTILEPHHLLDAESVNTVFAPFFFGAKRGGRSVRVLVEHVNHGTECDI